MANDELNAHEIRGFYYDHQIMNPLYTVTLHPNTRPFDGGDKIDWKDAGSAVDSEGDMIASKVKVQNEAIKRHYDKEWDKFFTNGYSSETSGDPNDGILPTTVTGKWTKYLAEPICSSIFTDDFGFSINNEWSNWDAGSPIEQIYKSVRPYAPFISALGDGLGEATKSMKGTNDFGSDWANKIGGWVATAGEYASKLGSNLNKALYIQGTRYALYNGTSTNFNSMTMKFTLLSDWRPLYPGGPYEFITVFDQLNLMYPYCMGFYEKNQGGLGWVTKGLNDKLKTTIDDFVDKNVGWQNPPGGFEAINKNIDVQQKGTLRMMFGGYYTIDNLVVKDFQVNMSRQLCKDPRPKQKGGMVPMYADVQITLQPASVYTDSALARFIGNAGMKDIQKAFQEALNKPKQQQGKGQEGKTEQNAS